VQGAALAYPQLNPRARGWLKHVHRKAHVADNWDRGGHPHEIWDGTSSPPMLSWHRFDLIDSSYAIAMMSDVTPAWREVYGEILDLMMVRYTAYWGAIDWLEQIGHDPKRGEYPENWYKNLIPPHLRGKYDVPGWTANGVEPWGLEMDPIGAQGNLFYKGFFNLLLSLHLYVTGDPKWNDPFDVVRDGENTFTYTHDGVHEVLRSQWANRPEGCHCENTKIWPYCLTAAGLGLSIYDRLRGADSHWVFDQWWDVAEKRYMSFDDDGRPATMGLYYDPEIDWLQPGGPVSALAVAFYLAPQRRDLARRMFQWAVDDLHWDDPERAFSFPNNPRYLASGLALAREFGDETVYATLRGFAEHNFEPIFDEERGEFYFGFGLEEPHPRGQPNATIMVGEIAGERAWSRMFTDPNLGKLLEPTVTGVEFPAVGLSRAIYDPAHEALAVSTYAADPAAAGRGTAFTVEQLPDASEWRVWRDGRPYDRIRVVARDRIEISGDIAEHDYLIRKGLSG
jgi:hypothetical protein